MALDADILGRIARPDDEDVLALELVSAAEVVRMQDAPRELVETIEIGDVRGLEMTGRHDDVIESLG